jgi:hypothetical protein
MAAKKKARSAKKKARAKKGSWGGSRPGAGRPKGSGSGPSPNSRRNRVAVMFTDTELKVLNTLAKKQRIPVATVAYRQIAKALKRK